MGECASEAGGGNSSDEQTTHAERNERREDRRELVADSPAVKGEVVVERKERRRGAVALIACGRGADDACLPYSAARALRRLFTALHSASDDPAPLRRASAPSWPESVTQSLVKSLELRVVCCTARLPQQHLSVEMASRAVVGLSLFSPPPFCQIPLASQTNQATLISCRPPVAVLVLRVSHESGSLSVQH